MLYDDYVTVDDCMDAAAEIEDVEPILPSSNFIPAEEDLGEFEED